MEAVISWEFYHLMPVDCLSCQSVVFFVPSGDFMFKYLLGFQCSLVTNNFWCSVGILIKSFVSFPPSGCPQLCFCILQLYSSFCIFFTQGEAKMFAVLLLSSLPKMQTHEFSLHSTCVVCIPNVQNFICFRCRIVSRFCHIFWLIFFGGIKKLELQLSVGWLKFRCQQLNQFVSSTWARKGRMRLCQSKMSKSCQLDAV